MSIGHLEVVPVVPLPVQWVVGAAPKEEPFWHLGEKRARLFLLFLDDGEARAFMMDAMNARASTIKDFAQRTLQDLCLSPLASVVELHGEPRLWTWMHEVIEGGSATFPPEIAAIEADVLLLPRRGERSGRLAVVNESAFEAKRVRCSNPRSLTFGTEDCTA